jgi:DNA uptake protein ComE-like DNA-binding protein
MKLQSLIGRTATVLLMLTIAACGSGSANSQSAAVPTNGPTAATNAPTTQPATEAAVAATSASTNNPDTTQVAPVVAKFNLNTASAEDFLTIPGVGDRMVREFQEYRPYVSIQQFRREIGKYVDAQQVAEYEEYVYVPISINESDAATLEQIPGLDETEAAALLAGRPYGSSDAFFVAVAEYVSEAELAVAKTYLGD